MDTGTASSRLLEPVRPNSTTSLLLARKHLSSNLQIHTSAHIVFLFRLESLDGHNYPYEYTYIYIYVI